MRFAGKTALVTGAAGAIGKGIAARLADEGAAVFLTDIDPRRLEEARAEIAAAGGTCGAMAGDVTRGEDVKNVVAAAAAAMGGRIDVLVNVAGTVGDGGPVERMTEATWDFVFDVNCKGTFLFTREVVPLMKKHKGGSIVNFSSKSGKTGSALMSAYSAAKAAVIGFTQALAFELAGAAVRVNCVCPGITEDTGVWSKVSADYTATMNLPKAEIVKKFTSKVPMGRLARIQDVVAVTCFLASDEADYMTGQAVNITGGREMH